MVPANTAYRAAELAHLVHDARPHAAITDDPPRAQALCAADPALLSLTPGLALPDGDPPALDAAPPEAPALIGYTSGTTGRPKGAVLSHANLLASVESLRLAWRWSPDDRLVLALPLFHMHGLGVGLHGSLHAGGSAWLVPQFEPGAVVHAIARARATLFFGVPTMYHRLVAAEATEALRGLRLCVSGSAALPADQHAAFERACGQRILERYGMTETVMLVSNPVEGERRPGTVGLPLPGVEVRLAGDPPQIEVRGPNVFAGYWERPDANAEAFTADGWFRTGDLGELDAAGYLRITGRAKELIIMRLQRLPARGGGRAARAPRDRGRRGGRHAVARMGRGGDRLSRGPCPAGPRRAAPLPRRPPRALQAAADPAYHRLAAAQRARQGAEAPAARRPRRTGDLA